LIEKRFCFAKTYKGSTADEKRSIRAYFISPKVTWPNFIATKLAKRMSERVKNWDIFAALGLVRSQGSALDEQP
jgi:hypothetical protein